MERELKEDRERPWTNTKIVKKDNAYMKSK